MTGNIDLNKDTFREFLEEVYLLTNNNKYYISSLYYYNDYNDFNFNNNYYQLPLEDVEDSTLVCGVRTLKELERSMLKPASQQQQQSRYFQMHNWINKMLDDGHLWDLFIE